MFVTLATGRCSLAPAETFAPAPVTAADRRSGITTPSAPAASAVRRIAPRLCGSSTPSSTTISERSLIVVLDGVEDPHNLGAILRTADAAGADGVVIPERRSAAVAGAVAKVSAGASEHLPVAKVTNI